MTSDRQLLQETHDAVIALAAEAKSTKKSVARNTEAIFGNGQRGLKAKMLVGQVILGYVALISTGLAVNLVVAIVRHVCR